MQSRNWFSGLALAVALAMGIAGCEGGGGDGESSGGSSTDGSISLTCKVNGQTVTVSGAGTVVANYQVDEDLTVVQTGGPGDYKFVLAIPGNRTGNWSITSRYLSLSVLRYSDVAVFTASADNDDAGATLQVRITSYGSVGNNVTGTFSGTVINPLTGATLVITDGEFTAGRIADI
jgi:hypothetical protein